MKSAAGSIISRAPKLERQGVIDVQKGGDDQEYAPFPLEHKLGDDVGHVVEHVVDVCSSKAGHKEAV